MLIFLWFYAVMSATIPGADTLISKHASTVTEQMKASPGRALLDNPCMDDSPRIYLPPDLIKVAPASQVRMSVQAVTTSAASAKPVRPSALPSYTAPIGAGLRPRTD
jgi:hypothetical protein